jgi:hypothetical protein
MHIGNFQAASGRLQESLEQLQLAWADAAELWRDTNASEFEEQHLRLIFEEIQTALPAVSQLTQIIQSAVRELEER